MTKTLKEIHNELLEAVEKFRLDLNYTYEERVKLATLREDLQEIKEYESALKEFDIDISSHREKLEDIYHAFAQAVRNLTSHKELSVEQVEEFSSTVIIGRKDEIHREILGIEEELKTLLF